MALSLGSSLADKIYLGATEVALAYLGSTQVYSAGGAFSAEAQDYFDRLDTAGDTTYTTYKQPLANYIDGLVALGGAYWDNLESAASFVGVGIQGVTVPLKSTMPTLTNNNFVSGDLNQVTGLLCNGTSKIIKTNTDQSNYAQNDTSASVYRTETVSGTNPFHFGTNLSNGFGARGSFITACYGLQAVTGSASTTVGLLGLSRSASTGYDYRSNGTTGTRTTASVTPASGNLDIFAINGTTSGSFRLATYHAGPALDLATLEGLQDTLITEVEAVWNTLVYQSDFANGATEWTAARGTNTAPDSPDASTNVMSYVPNVGIQTHYTRLSTSNINLTDEYLTQFEIYIPSSNVTVDGFKVTDWTSTTVFDNTIPTSDTWKSISFISKYENVGVPAIWQTAAGSVSFNGNGTDKIYIRNFRVLKQS